jgi:hypothetical protein
MHPPLCKLKKYRKEPYMMGIKVFNHLPQTLKDLVHNPKQFKNALKRFLLHQSFYSSKEYFEFTERL